jgi:hypothetical protein
MMAPVGYFKSFVTRTAGSLEVNSVLSRSTGGILTHAVFYDFGG